MPKSFTDLRIIEPAKGRNRALYQNAIDALAGPFAKHVEYNPTTLDRMYIMVRYYSPQMGYAVYLKHTDTFTGGSFTDALVFSKHEYIPTVVTEG
jgi:hypothetical protein